MSGQPPNCQVQAAKAKLWRKSIARMTRKELARRIGYTAVTIQHYETGRWANGTAISDAAWERYWAACSGVEPHAGKPGRNVKAENAANP